MATSENRSDSDNGGYTAAVERAVKNPKRFNRFKRDPDYQLILEHATRAQAEAYLDIVREQTPHFFEQIEAFRHNDVVGSPVLYEFPNVGMLSPSTARYMKVASDLLTLFGDLEGGHIVEIGAGYGGQMLICDRALSARRYTMFDLPPVLELISKYLESFLLNGSYDTLTLNRCPAMTGVDLVVSNYAFSELPAQIQLTYLDKVLAQAKRGYLTMNSGTGQYDRDTNKLTLDEIRDRLPESRVLDERPLTSPGNYVLVWGEQGTATAT